MQQDFILFATKIKTILLKFAEKIYHMPYLRLSKRATLADTKETDKKPEEQTPAKSPKLMIIIPLVVLLVAGGGGVAWFFLIKKPAEEGLQLDDPKDKESSEKSEEGEAEEGKESGEGENNGRGTIQRHHNGFATVAIDDFIVDLESQSGKAYFLKIKIILELKDKKGIEEIDKNIYRIRDICQIYLRTLRPSDLRGNSGIQIIKENLMLRINNIIYPMQLENILFGEFIIS